jgi:CBS domain-containing protein
MRADDVMTSNLVTVGEDASVRDVALVLLQNQISAVPVIDRMGNMIGIVSEGDLMRRPGSDTQLSSEQAMGEAEFVKMHSRHVTDVMTRGVITATSDTPVAKIAFLLEKNGIKRVPILRGGKLVGIVSRANLLQGLASLKNRAPKSVASAQLEGREVTVQRCSALFACSLHASKLARSWASPLLAPEFPSSSGVPPPSLHSGIHNGQV